MDYRTTEGGRRRLRQAEALGVPLAREGRARDDDRSRRRRSPLPWLLGGIAAWCPNSSGFAILRLQAPREGLALQRRDERGGEACGHGLCGSPASSGRAEAAFGVLVYCLLAPWGGQAGPVRAGPGARAVARRQALDREYDGRRVHLRLDGHGDRGAGSDRRSPRGRCVQGGRASQGGANRRGDVGLMARANEAPVSRSPFFAQDCSVPKAYSLLVSAWTML
mmetsp:Transcript_120975/g.342276  ORF Transcript_120975/g.342276 Transcript_120975/m.342276 type:complete len:222 (-) Transcript_120975:6-671(-)